MFVSMIKSFMQDDLPDQGMPVGSVFGDIPASTLIGVFLFIVVLFVGYVLYNRRRNRNDKILSLFSVITILLVFAFFTFEAMVVFITGKPAFPINMIIDANSDWYGPSKPITPALLVGILLFLPVMYVLTESLYRVWIRQKSNEAARLSISNVVSVGGNSLSPFVPNFGSGSNYNKVAHYMRLSFFSLVLFYGVIGVILGQLHVFVNDVKFEPIDESNLLGIFNWSVESGFLTFFLLSWGLSLVFTALLLSKEVVLPIRLQLLFFALVMFLVVGFMPFRVLVHADGMDPYWETRTLLEFYFDARTTGSIYFFERVIGVLIGGLTFFISMNVIIAFSASIIVAGLFVFIKAFIPNNLYDLLFGYVTGAKVFVGVPTRHRRRRTVVQRKHRRSNKRRR